MNGQERKEMGKGARGGEGGEKRRMEKEEREVKKGKEGVFCHFLLHNFTPDSKMKFGGPRDLYLNKAGSSDRHRKPPSITLSCKNYVLCRPSN